MIFQPRPGAASLTRALIGRGIAPAVARAMAAVPRELFVPTDLQARAYEDRPLAIGSGQTISQPFIVGLMIQALEPDGHGRVLEIGTGSGYQTAILSRLADEVCTIERIPELLAPAVARLQALGVANVRARLGDGTLGWPEAAPFERIVVSAAAPRIPTPLTDQLADDGGRLVIPVGPEKEQRLLSVRRRGKELEVKDLGPCAFVRLVGELAYPEEGQEGVE
jgi:protein-L-isoaspartate(D-aspartate) O-methyltransferase